jgi:glucose/mannose-6-phosphate isomerase
MAKTNLDDPKIYARYDPEDMLGRIKELPGQCRQAWQEAQGFKLPADYKEVDKVVILGMGGSAIGGDLVRSLAEPESKIPVIIHRDYGLPPFVDDRSLVIVSSYSGNTEETLSAFEQALKTGARKLVLTTGGKIQTLAAEKNIPVFKITYKAQPRAALGFSFLPTLCFLQKLGIIGDKSADAAEMIKVLESLAARIDDKAPLSSNPAKELAYWLEGCLPVVYGAGIAAEAAHRWKTQFNENGKSWAFYEIFPELNHNATVGYQFPKEVARKIRVVLLRAPSLNERVRLRYEVTAELLERAGIAHRYVDSEGESRLSQMMSLVLLGDFVSYYLAILYRINPTPVDVISYLKDRLAKG